RPRRSTMSSAPSAGTLRAINGTDHVASNPVGVMFCVVGSTPPLKLGDGQSPFIVSNVVRAKARNVNRCAPVNFMSAFTSNLLPGGAMGAGVPKKVRLV